MKRIYKQMKFLKWMFIYSRELGVTGFRTKYNFYNNSKNDPPIVPYKYLLRFVAKKLAQNRVIFGEQKHFDITSNEWDKIVQELNISPISKNMLAHLFTIISYNDISILNYIYNDYDLQLHYNQKCIEY